MSKKNQAPDTLELLEAAKRNAEASKGRLDSTLVALQSRLKPANLANEAWTGVKETTTELTDRGVQEAKKRPGVIAAAVGVGALLLARKPLTRAVSHLLFGQDDDDGRITTTIPTPQEKLDLSAPVVDLSKKGVSHGQVGHQHHDEHDRDIIERQLEPRR